MVRALYYIGGLTMAVLTAAAPRSIVPRDVEWIGHDEVEGFGEDAPDVVKRFQPYLQVNNGCVPWPAVDKNGRVGGGLKPTGMPSDGCSGSEGQVYSRATYHDGKLGIMYAWYFPKDQPAGTAIENPSDDTGAHRHDWEEIVVWLTDNTENAELLGLAWSQHGEYKKDTVEKLKADSRLDGDHPLVRYYTVSAKNHALTLTSDKGGSQPVIHWPNLTKAAQDALNSADYERAVVPFKGADDDDNSKFKEKIRAAAL